MRLLAPLLCLFLLVACTTDLHGDSNLPVFPTYDPSVDQPKSAAGSGSGVQLAEPTLTPYLPPTRPANEPPPSTPTPDQPKQLPTLRTQEVKYTVQPNDTLGGIARKFGVSVDLIMQANKLTNANIISVGITLVIPPPPVTARGPSFKVIPDSELVLGPYTAGFKLADFIKARNGYLAQYTEKVDDIPYTGAQVVDRIAREYSVNPRLLLAVLEYQSGWVTRQTSPDNRRDYPIGKMDSYRRGLYKQLAWAADNLNRGYYLWRANASSGWDLADGGMIVTSPEINAGTAGVQHFFGLLNDRANWEKAVGEKGLYAIYTQFFGNPFEVAYEPLTPANLSQPKLQLPFEDGDVWSFTGGPHGGWGVGSAWAALDFAPPGEGGGCRPSIAWVVAAAGGVIVRSEFGEVVQDLDGDGDERTGWTILYMHVGSAERVKVGAKLKVGDRIGHPSCEGGVSNGTHVHLARRYNGEWIAADGNLPFNLDGWISSGDGVEYYGSLKRNGTVLEAWDSRVASNQIER